MITNTLRPLLVSILLVCFGISAVAAGQPNILFILTDDQGAWTTGFSGNTQTHTPNLDRLASEGARFTNAFCVTPVCSPSRVSVLTGRYALEFGIPDWIQPSSDEGLPPGTLVWPKLLQQAGYHTGLVGKWHVGHQPQHHPTNFGYDYFMGFLTGGTQTKNPTLEEDGITHEFEGLTVDILTDRALKFIDNNKAGPFLLSLHYRAPHAAYMPVSDEDWSHFEGRDMEVPSYPKLDVARAKRSMAEYLASIAGVDRNVGKILARLDELGIADNTIVIFTSDHGYNLGHHGVWAKGNAVWMLTDTPPKEWPNIDANRRPNLWDTSLKTPTVVRWPGTVKPGTLVENTVTHLDWFPTICAMAGVEIPADAKLRGLSIVPLLRGEHVPWDDGLYAEYNMRQGAETEMRAYRTTEWKLMRDFNNPGRAELFHLTDDPDELHNVFDNPENDALIRTLDKKILTQLRRNGDPIAERYGR